MTYRYPRTVEEMIPVREAEVTQYPVPECSHGHGPMALRALAEQPYEQMFCGIWYDCRDERLSYGSYCSTILLKSRDLAHQLGEPWNDGAQWWQHNGTAWVKISDGEASEFWQERAAEREERERERLAAARRKPTVSYDGKTYTVRSRKTEIPDFTTMSRIAVLAWLNSNTYAKGAGIRTKPNPLAGIGDAIKVTVR